MTHMIDKINKLRKEKNAVILAHNYQAPEIQDIADVVGDSLGLSIEASKTNADVIVFCGVHFMAETAKILSPGKTVLLPDRTSGCPMADMIDSEGLAALQTKHPDAVTMCYVNSSATVKALCDYCCTSANALNMTERILSAHKDIIFVPDQYLAAYVSSRVGHPFITWPGYCPIHAEITPEDVRLAKNLHPYAEVLVHPECRPETTELADVVCSTEGMCTYALRSTNKEFLIGTEIGILHRLRKENPDKTFYPVSDKAICHDMKRIVPEKVLKSLETMTHEIVLHPDIQEKARLSIDRMLKTV